MPIVKPDIGEANWNVDLDAALDTLEAEAQQGISAAAAAQATATQAQNDAAAATTTIASVSGTASAAQSAANSAATTAANASTAATAAQTTATTALNAANAAQTTANSKVDATQLATKEPTVVAGTSGQYYRGDKTWQTLNKTAVGLPNVDNTADASKPISTAQLAAFAIREPVFIASGDDSDLAAALAEAPVGWTGFVAVEAL